MIAGEAQVMFEPMSASIGRCAGQAARTRGDHAARSATLPDVPTVGEAVPGYEASAATGLGAPKGTPVEIIEP